ncbi:MAG: ferritin family protein [bacterium]|nr:ferritin family protein [bacterium]
MNVFEFAMQMELDGKNYYEEHAAKVAHPALKKILLEMASDEDKHYEIFKALRDGLSASYDDAKATTIFTSVKNVFEEIKTESETLDFAEEAKKVWEHARQIEKKAESFYREKADEVDDDNAKHIFHRIADEEHKHWVTMDNVIAFLDKPNQWLEDAEWNSIDDM